MIDMRIRIVIFILLLNYILRRLESHENLVEARVAEVRKKLSKEEMEQVMAPRRPERAVTKNHTLSALRENR